MFWLAPDACQLDEVRRPSQDASRAQPSQPTVAVFIAADFSCIGIRRTLHSSRTRRTFIARGPKEFVTHAPVSNRILASVLLLGNCSFASAQSITYRWSDVANNFATDFGNVQVGSQISLRLWVEQSGGNPLGSDGGMFAYAGRVRYDNPFGSTIPSTFASIVNPGSPPSNFGRRFHADHPTWRRCDYQRREFVQQCVQHRIQFFVRCPSRR